MNAYELADKLQMDKAKALLYVDTVVQSAEMLRQQADRIDKLEREAVAKNNYLEQHCEKIDQQADRIAELEKLVHQRFDDGKRLGVLETENKFKSPPCAWMVKTNDGKKLMLYGEEQPPKFADEVQAIPLYTTPQTKPLSDEEIEEIAKQHLAAYAQFIGAGEVCYEGEIEFARAIEERHGIK